MAVTRAPWWAHLPVIRRIYMRGYADAVSAVQRMMAEGS